MSRVFTINNFCSTIIGMSIPGKHTVAMCACGKALRSKRSFEYHRTFLAKCSIPESPGE
uniref:Uncharacterized protein n=1 Tax=Anopheles minimus TaxID=112268 RepID=A0A182WQ00_9DIPT